MRKKALSLLLAAITAMCFVSCGGESNGGEATTARPEPAPSEDKLESWTGYGYDKIRLDLGKPADAASEQTVYAAKGETEGCSVGIWSTTALDGALKFSVLSGENSDVECKLYEVRKGASFGRQIYSDPAVLVEPEDEFIIKAKRTSAFLVEFTTSESTPAGDYTYEVGFTDKKGNVVAKHKITLHVWDFALPEEKAFVTSIGYDETPLYKYYELLYEHGMCGQRIPYELTDPLADMYMSDPRITAFRIDHKFDDEKLLAIYKKLQTNPEWLEKAYFYPMDEPRTVAELDKLALQCERLRKLCPEIRITSAFYTNNGYNGELDQVGFMAQHLDLHCAKLTLWDTYSSRFGSFADRMKALQERGDDVWAYVSSGTTDKEYLNVEVFDEGLESRVIFWQIYQRDIDGFLYWHSDYWTQLPEKNPWLSLNTQGAGIYGDGILSYPGEYIGRDYPIPSIRLKIMRDGVDDIELLYLAEKYLGEDWAKAKAAQAGTSLKSLDITSDAFAVLRIEVGNAIEKAQTNK